MFVTSCHVFKGLMLTEFRTTFGIRFSATNYSKPRELLAWLQQKEKVYKYLREFEHLPNCWSWIVITLWAIFSVPPVFYDPTKKVTPSMLQADLFDS